MSFITYPRKVITNRIEWVKLRAGDEWQVTDYFVGSDRASDLEGERLLDLIRRIGENLEIFRPESLDYNHYCLVLDILNGFLAKRVG